MRVVINPKVASIGTSQWPRSVVLEVENDVRVTQCPKSTRFKPFLVAPWEFGNVPVPHYDTGDCARPGKPG